MARIERSSGSAWLHLRARHLFGRSTACDLRWEDPRVSGEHAVLFWTGSGWALRDLGSRNGTWVGGARVGAGEEVAVPVGAVVACGSERCAVRLVDGGPPGPFASRPDGAEIGGVGGILALDELTSVYRDPEGAWQLEEHGRLSPVADRQRWVHCGEPLVLHLPVEPVGTEDSVAATVERLGLAFHVSADEEHVRVRARIGERDVALKRRSHHYLLLTLARARMADRASAVPASERGWLYLDDLARMLRSNENRLNVEIFRARQQVAELGVIDAANLVQRRPATRQVRLGCDALTVAREA